jgi:hypothetical protein
MFNKNFKLLFMKRNDYFESVEPLKYQAPAIEIVEVIVEQGFAPSQIDPGSPPDGGEI